MRVVALCAGAAVVGGVLLDLFLTVFQPSLRGPLSERLNRTIWGLVRSAARRGDDRLLSFGGPLAVVADVALWAGGLVVGFALVYAPFIDDFSYASAASFGDPGVVESVYVSGVIAFTLGFGDVVADTDALRLLTVVEAAAGAAVLSAAISYVLNVYPAVTGQRATAQRFSDLRLDSAAGAMDVIAARGLRAAEPLHQALIITHQHLRRYPVLYYFHPRDVGESTYVLLRGAATMCAVLRWGVGTDAVPGAERYGRAIEATLRRTIADYVAGYITGLDGGAPPADPAAARERLRALREAAGDHASQGDASEFAHYLSNVDAFLARLAAAHRYHHRPLLEPVSPPHEQSPTDDGGVAARRPTRART